ncbi:hypothetical protein RMATCC62417_06653 [Rhizopus microsporus]|nr:hypothetical protein RMATCC62417_06653 [Rhizopus microsporus]
MVQEKTSLVTWIVDILKKRQYKATADPINDALVHLLTDVISFHEATGTSVLHAFFELIRADAKEMTWLLNLIGEKLPHHVLPQIHEYLVLGLSVYGNPFLGSKNGEDTMNENQISLIHIGNSLFQHLLSIHPNQTVESLTTIQKRYLDWISNPSVLSTDFQKFTLGYLLSLPKISPALLNESWSSMFNLIYENNTAGSIFYHEKNTLSSIAKNKDGEIEPISHLFSRWLATVAFDPKGYIMRHAMDVMIMLDTLAYDSRLDLSHLLPTGDRSILDTLQPSIKQLNLEPASIDLFDWINSRTAPNDLRIPLFLLQLIMINNDSKEYTANLFVQLITRLNCAKDLVLKLIPTAESKWPGIFQIALENIFSKTIAIHIANTTQIEKILGNLAALYEDSQKEPGYQAFHAYINSHSRQVLLVFINHPSTACRVMGYRVLNNSKFYQQMNPQDQEHLSQLLVDAWFRHLKGRYFGQESKDLLYIQQRLIVNCCQNISFGKAILSVVIEYILNGALEIFPTIDVDTLQQQQSSLFDRIHSKEYATSQSQAKKPPKFVTLVDILKQDIDKRDKIYMDNIEQTASLFDKFKDCVSSEQYSDIHHHILFFLSSKWSPSAAPMTAYDDALPRNIPYPWDITIGSAFKDHPALFPIFEKCIQVVKPATTNDIIRSILVYFIVFWNMKEVVTVPTTLTYATQLEETIRLVLLLKPSLPQVLVNSYRLFPFLSAKELGDLLYQVIWSYVRHSTNIPGIHKTEDKQLVEKCKETMLSICQHRLKILEKTPSWHQALQQTIINFIG